MGVEGSSKENNAGNLVRSTHSFGGSFFFFITILRERSIPYLARYSSLNSVAPKNPTHSTIAILSQQKSTRVIMCRQQTLWCEKEQKKKKQQPEAVQLSSQLMLPKATHTIFQSLTQHTPSLLSLQTMFFSCFSSSCSCGYAGIVGQRTMPGRRRPRASAASRSSRHLLTCAVVVVVVIWFGFSWFFFCCYRFLSCYILFVVVGVTQSALSLTVPHLHATYT